MLQESFCFLPGCGMKTEQHLWRQGITSWQAFLRRKTIRGLSARRKECYDRVLRQAITALQTRNYSFFLERVPNVLHYRLFDVLRQDCLFLDIETRNKNGDVTIIGLSDGENTKTLVKGKNCDKKELVKALRRTAVLVTFNGRAYDIPLLRRLFGSLPEVPHIDLRHVAARLGYHGGLKEVEKALHIRRTDAISLLHSGDPTLLWKKYVATGDDYFLQLLIEYNTADVENLQYLAEQLIPALWKKEKITSSCLDSQ